MTFVAYESKFGRFCTGPILSPGWPSALIPTRVVSVFMPVGIRFVVDFRCGISKSECFLGLGICNPESLSIALPVLRCLVSGIRATVSGPTGIP